MLSVLSVYYVKGTQRAPLTTQRDGERVSVSLSLALSAYVSACRSSCSCSSCFVYRSSLVVFAPHRQSSGHWHIPVKRHLQFVAQSVPFGAISKKQDCNGISCVVAQLFCPKRVKQQKNHTQKKQQKKETTKRKEIDNEKK